MEIKSYAECLTYSERTVKLNSMRETSRNAPTLKKLVCVFHNIEIEIHAPLVTWPTMSIHHQSKSHFKTLAEGKKNSVGTWNSSHLQKDEF